MPRIEETQSQTRSLAIPYRESTLRVERTCVLRRESGSRTVCSMTPSLLTHPGQGRGSRNRRSPGRGAPIDLILRPIILPILADRINRRMTGDDCQSDRLDRTDRWVRSAIPPPSRRRCQVRQFPAMAELPSSPATEAAEPPRIVAFERATSLGEGFRSRNRIRPAAGSLGCEGPGVELRGPLADPADLLGIRSVGRLQQPAIEQIRASRLAPTSSSGVVRAIRASRCP